MRKEKWDSKTERRSANIEEVNNSIQLLVLPIMQQQTKILSELEELARDNSERMLNLNYSVQFGVTGLKENQEKMRDNLHTINTNQQRIISELQNRRH